MNHKIVLLVSLSLLACDSSRQPSASRESANSSRTNTAAPVSGPDSTWVLTPDRTGRVSIGMKFSELASQMVNPGDTATIMDGCDFVRIREAPDGLEFMVEGRTLVRVQTENSGFRTMEGAKVGDTEARILELYPDARQQPHKYIEGKYFIVIPGAPGDTIHRYVFETDGHRVIKIRAGIYPPVEYVEDCG